MKKLLLKSTLFVKRFVVTDSDSTDSEDHNDNNDVEEVGKQCLSTNTTLQLKGSQEFINYSIFVKYVDHKCERIVDTKDGHKTREDNASVDQLIDCRDLRQMDNILRKCNQSTDNGREVVTKKKKNKKKKRKNKPKNGNENQCQRSDGSLMSEGIRITNTKRNKTYICLVCDMSFSELKAIWDHIESDIHLENIFGDRLDGTDALFTIDSERIGDVFIAIARRQELKKITSDDKQLYFDHGIRLKDGFGTNAYICLKCNLCFDSLQEVIKHMKSIQTVIPQSIDGKSAQNTELNPIDLKLKNEGIEFTESSAEFKYFCIFCNVYLDCKRTALSHTHQTRHKKTRRGEHLSEIDANFVTQSERIDDFEVAFSRRQIIKNICPKTKIQFTDECIRLKDGIGLNAFICQKCELNLQTVDDIQSHIKSSTHSKVMTTDK